MPIMHDRHAAILPIAGKDVLPSDHARGQRAQGEIPGVLGQARQLQATVTVAIAAETNIR